MAAILTCDADSELSFDHDAARSARRTSQVLDQLYLLQAGFIFTTPSVVTKVTSRSTATILLTVKRASFELSISGNASRHQAAAVQPLVERSVNAEDAQLVSIQVSPHHSEYRRFRALPFPGYLPLNRDAFTAFDGQLEAAYQGKLSVDDATELFEGIVATTAQYLPRVRRADPRVQKALELLKENPNFPLTELAAQLGVSYHRMSRLFAEVVGLSLRSYILWVKVRTASSFLGSGMSLTEVALRSGFSSSAHLCNTWMRAFASPPSHAINGASTQLHCWKPAKGFSSGGVKSESKSGDEKASSASQRCR